MKKRYSSVIILLLSAGLTFTLYKTFKTLSAPKQKKEQTPPATHRMTVFIHGTFGSQMGLLSYSDVVHGKVKGTLYKKLQKKMRKDPSYYTAQPIQEKGLLSIDPTFDYTQIDNKKYAAYPIIKAYQMLAKSLETIDPTKNNEINHYYTFGWSGLISQHQRRAEAIRLYNILSLEVEKFRQQGIDPKITILTHSHGGNLCLNLAPLSYLLNSQKLISGGPYVSNSDANESIEKTAAILKTLPQKENTMSIEGQRKYDYLPTNKDLVIDELILLGTPIQVETEYFWHFDIFKHIYHIYSDSDTVQEMDWVSTKKNTSSKRFTIDPDNKKLTQIRIMYNKNITQRSIMAEAPTTDATNTPSLGQNLNITVTPEAATQLAKQAETGVSEHEEPKSLRMLLGSLFSYAKIMTGKKKSFDPEHKELWFICWELDKNTQESDNNDFITPLPTVIFIPGILANLKAYNTLTDHKVYDVDINFTHDADFLNLQLLLHDDGAIKRTERVPWSIVEHIKQEIRKWRPDSTAN